jgi:hypothetical protein
VDITQPQQQVHQASLDLVQQDITVNTLPQDAKVVP